MFENVLVSTSFFFFNFAIASFVARKRVKKNIDKMKLEHKIELEKAKEVAFDEGWNAGMNISGPRR